MKCTWTGRGRPEEAPLALPSTQQVELRVGFELAGVNTEYCCGLREANFISCHLAIMWKLHENNGPHGKRKIRFKVRSMNVTPFQVMRATRFTEY